MSKQARSAATRERLLEAGLVVLLEQGYHGTGIKQVLDRIQVPKGSFYNYFESKERFAAEVVRRYSEQVLANLDERLADADADAHAAVDGFFAAEIERFGQCRTGCLMGNLGAELGAENPLCRVALAEAMMDMTDRFASAIEAGQRQGRFRTDVPAGELAAFLVDAYEGALIRLKVEASVQPLRRCRSQVMSLLRA